MKEYHPITELLQQRLTRVYAEIRNKQLKLHDMTCDIRNQYMITVRNKFDIIQKASERHAPNDEYENLTHIKAATKCIPSKPRAKCVCARACPWKSIAVRERQDNIKKSFLT